MIKENQRSSTSEWISLIPTLQVWPEKSFLQLEQQLLVHIACKRRKRLQLVSEKNKWPLFAAKGDNGLIGYCTRWQGSWLRELQRTYPFTMVRYRGSALQLLRVKSGVFLFFLFFLTKIISFWTFTQSRSALKTFCLVSNNAAPEILTRLISNKKIISANGSFSRRLLRRNTGGLQIILKSFTVKLIRLEKSNSWNLLF